MSATKPPLEELSQSDFATQAQQSSQGIIREFYDFLRHNKKWWLTPIFLSLLLVALLLVLSSSAVAPFIYTLF